MSQETQVITDAPENVGDQDLFSFESNPQEFIDVLPEDTTGIFSEPETTETPDTASETQAIEPDNDTPETTEANNKNIEEEEEDDDDDDASIFVAPKSKGIIFKTEDDAKAHIKEKLGFDVSKPEGYAKLVEAYNKQRKNAQKATELEKWAEDIKNDFASLPEPIINAIAALNEGKDWKQAINSSVELKIDFRKNFEDQDTWALIETYASDIIDNKEDFEDDPNSAQVRAALRVAERMFKTDKREHELQSAERKRIDDASRAKIASSISGSLDVVKTDFPGMKDKDVKRIEKVLSGGGIMDLFVNKDGTFKADAAKKLAYIEFAPTEIERLTKQVAELKKQVKTASDKTANIVLRSRDGVEDERGDKNRTDKPDGEGILPSWMNF
jgi:hypothetical protein